jgi:hypothetical protein
MKLRWPETLLRIDEASNEHTILVRNALGKPPVGGPSRRRQGCIKMAFKETDCEDGEWMELVQNRVKFWAVLKFWILLPESQLISKMDLRETGCEDGR